MRHHSGEHCTDLQERNAASTSEDVTWKWIILQRPDELITDVKKFDSQGSICSRYRCMINFRLSCASNDETGSDKFRRGGLLMTTKAFLRNGGGVRWVDWE